MSFSQGVEQFVRAGETRLEMLRELCRPFGSPFIDEALYRQVLGGPRSDLSTIDSYLRLPVKTRPNLTIFFDPDYYLSQNDEVVADQWDPLLHFLCFGLEQNRDPHPLISLPYLRMQEQALFAEKPTEEALVMVLAGGSSDPSPYFDCRFYLEQLGDEAIDLASPLRHYLTFGMQRGLWPNQYLDPSWYSARYDDVPADPKGAIRHFITIGDREGRASSPAFDGSRYQARYPDVVGADIAPLLHYLMFGRIEGRQVPRETVPVRHAVSLQLLHDRPADETVDWSAARGAYTALKDGLRDQRRAEIEGRQVVPAEIHRLTAQQAAAAKLSFPRVAKPKVSILIPCFNEGIRTIECLLSLRDHVDMSVCEIVLADDASTDTLVAGLARVKGITVVRQASNVGFLANCNAAYARCRGEYVLLLNNDAQMASGAVEALVECLDRDPGLGAAGPKIVYPNGRLQEAGCSINADGSTEMVGVGDDPLCPQYNYERDTHYVSGAALLVRRGAVGKQLFDEQFAPAYCEDVDLCLRLLAKGLRVRYRPDAVCVHHLSASTGRLGELKRRALVNRNQQRLLETWQPLIKEQNRIRTIGFYLPQFHPTPENDRWWGTGFTEWRNVATARPSFADHYQPHQPADLGFYDLRVKGVFAQQARLARRYGIDGFCVYYYNFGSRRVLDTAVESVVADKSVDFPFCVCWANENWTKHWDGGSREILLEQLYDTSTLGAVLDDFVRYARDPRYITIDGKPLFMVYRPLQMPDPAGFARHCRARVRQKLKTDIVLAYVESMEAVDKAVSPHKIGFDAAIEFPPHGRAIASEDPVTVVKQGWAGYRYDYPRTVMEFVNRPGVPYKRFPSVFPSWDNTPRQPLRGTSFDKASPEAFQVYVEAKLQEVHRMFVGQERLLFVNAWNEWAEGAHLEPDARFGHRHLEALRDALAQGGFI